MIDYGVVVMGASLGGLTVYEKILPKIPGDFEAPILAVNHITKNFDKNWLHQIHIRSELDIMWGTEQQKIRANYIYFAPPGSHLIVTHIQKVGLSDGAPFFSCKPSINDLFKSAAKVYKNRVLAILLTGLNCDGTEGLKEVQKQGGTTIVQDPKTATAPIMPDSALREMKPTYIMSPTEIIKFLQKL